MRPTNFEEPKVQAVDFGQALKALRDGRRVSRRGWHLKGMFIYLVAPGRYPPSTAAGRAIAAEQPDGCVPYREYIAFRGSDGIVVPWVGTQTDILAEDWVVT